jgi:glycerophosphoryl diester phosphodiesterase
LHDATLGRTTNGPDEPVTKFTFTELSKFDAGRWFDPRFAGLRVPGLEETFALVRERKRRLTLLALNVKGITREGERELVRLLEKFKLFKESFAFDQSDECSERHKALDPRIRIGRNVPREEIESRLAEGTTDIYLLTSVPNEAEVSLLRKYRKTILFNYAGTGEHRREKKNWLRVRELGIDGMLTDYALQCAKLWQANPLENETQKKP